MPGRINSARVARIRIGRFEIYMGSLVVNATFPECHGATCFRNTRHFVLPFTNTHTLFIPSPIHKLRTGQHLNITTLLSKLRATSNKIEKTSKAAVPPVPRRLCHYCLWSTDGLYLKRPHSMYWQAYLTNLQGCQYQKTN